jgi:hypothetical protein
VLGTMFFPFGGKRSIYHHDAYPTCYLVEKPKLLFAAKALHVPFFICKL